MSNNINAKTGGFGTAPVFFTAISTILGAILFLRFGFAVGTLGFTGTVLIILVGHLVTIPTAMAISEIATNQKVEGGGEYYIISRSFGLNIGATIGISLYLSQAISVAFYVIAFTEAFAPLFELAKQNWGVDLPRQVVSVPAMLILGLVILKQGASLGVKALYVVVAVLFLSLFLFFIGSPEYAQSTNVNIMDGAFDHMDSFFVVFAICFPAFTGMTAGVGLSGDLKEPGKSIPMGTTAATIFGMIFYVFIAWKLAVSASPYDLVNDQLVMGRIAVFGFIAIPIGLAASTISSAIGSILVAPRTLQALGVDRSFPIESINDKVAKGKGENNEPYMATLITSAIAMAFVLMGDVNAVAEIISMFFMVTYGSICLISFLYHFGADPSYRPSFRSRWYISMFGFLMCIWLMFKINTPYAIMAIIMMVIIYIGVSYYHKDRQGLERIFSGAIFQLNRALHIFLQKSDREPDKDHWRPAVICISRDSLKRDIAFRLLSWISHKYGFGTYIHLYPGYYSRTTNEEAEEIKRKLIQKSEIANSKAYIDTMISPSYTTAIAQIIQLPSISGKENNMILFEFDQANPDNLQDIIDNFSLVRAGTYDVGILASSVKHSINNKIIHVWITSRDYENTNLMILLSYIILGHPEWKGGQIKIFSICKKGEGDQNMLGLLDLITKGRLPISQNNIGIIEKDPEVSSKTLIGMNSSDAALTVIGFRAEHIKHNEDEPFTGFENMGHMLFINAHNEKEIG